MATVAQHRSERSLGGTLAVGLTLEAAAIALSLAGLSGLWGMPPWWATIGLAGVAAGVLLLMPTMLWWGTRKAPAR